MKLAGLNTILIKKYKQSNKWQHIQNGLVTGCNPVYAGSSPAVVSKNGNKKMNEQIYKWGWCSHCQCAYIICPLCGNNTCNGGSGTLQDGTKCLKCDDAYKYHDKMEKLGKIPTYSEIRQ